MVTYDLMRRSAGLNRFLFQGLLKAYDIVSFQENGNCRDVLQKSISPDLRLLKTHCGKQWSVLATGFLFLFQVHTQYSACF